MYQEPMNVDGPECGGAIHAGIHGAGVNKATSTVLQIGAERVRALNQTIQNIQAVKKYLHLNSVEVKSSIHSTVSRLLESLRNREVWLLNQVDLVYQAKEEVLRRQEDKLNQAVGGLTNCIDLIETGSASEDELLAYLGSISTMDKHAEETPHISFRFDMLSLRDAIQKFGKVDSKGLSLPGAPFSLPCLEMTGGYGCVGVKDGSSLPRQFEEYGDDEHQILYKTVSSGVNRGSEDSIFVNIPRLSDNTKMAGGINTYQMSDAAGSRTTVLKGSRSSGVLENLLGEQETRMSRTSSLRQWLTDLTAHCDDDDGMMTESKLVNMACSQSSTDDNAAATSSTVSSTIEIRISAPDGDNDSEGGLNAVGGAIDSKVELFEGFRRICQRPLSDWLSKACAVIDSHCDQSKTAASLKYTLSIFQKVINSPFQEWLHASRSSANSSVSVAAWEPFNCVVDKIIDKHTATVREATRRKWLSEVRSEADGMISHDSQIDSCGDSAVISQDKNQPLNDVHAKNGVLFCPFRSYVRKLEQQPIGRWLTDGEAAGDGFSVSAGSQPNVYSPLAEYMRHCASQPSSYWLASSASKQETDGSNGSPGGLNNYNTKDAVSKEFEANLAGRRVSSVPLSDNGMAWYDIGSKFVHCPISQWLQQTSNANNLPENNIGSRIASMPISDWLKLTNEKYLMHASDNVDCDLKEQMEHSTLSDSRKSLAGDAVVLSKNLNKEVSDNYSHMTESLEELHMNDTEDLSCNGELDSLLASSFVEIIQDNTDDIVSASIALPAVFGQPVQYWHAQELRSGRCDDTALSQQSMNIGKSVLDGYALMQVSEWLGH